MFVMKNKFHPVLKLISIVLVHTFILSSIAFAVPQDPAQKGAPQPVLSKEQVTNPENIIIPKEFGVVKLSHKADGGKLIINIQDAHCNYEAQTNIAKMLETLVKNDNLTLVSVEGADGVIDTSWFKAFPDDEIRRQVADYFMKKGEITGPEFLSITTDYPIKLFGAETRSYYIENLNAFTSSYPLKDETEKYFNTIKAALNKLKALIYNEDLKRMDSKSDDYESKKLSFNEYVRFLQSEAEKNKINLRQYDNLFKLINVLIYEKKIDFNVTDKERSSLIDILSKKISKDSITELVSKSMAFKVGKISSVEYYNYLKNLAAMTGMDMARDYSNLYNYIIYNSVYSRIDNEKLFKDIAALESAIKEKLFENDDQRMLEKLSRHINMLIGLVNIKLLNDDFDYYSAHRDEFADEVFSGFITKKAAQFGLALAIDPPSDAVAKSIPKLEDFYTVAIKRDKALVDNTLAQMDKDGQKLAVLVTGGFHSEGMAKLLEKQGVSFMVVCPTITKDVPTRYIQVLTNQRTSFDDIVMGVSEQAPSVQNQGTLAPVLVTWARQQDKATLDLFSSVVQNLRSTMSHLEIGTPRERVEAVLDEFDYASLVELVRSALRFAEGKHLLIREESVVLHAIEQMYDEHLDELVKAKTITDDSAAQCRETVRSENFKKEFHKAFLTAQAPESRAALVQAKPESLNEESGNSITAAIKNRIVSELNSMAKELDEDINGSPFKEIIETTEKNLAKVAEYIDNGEIDPAVEIRTSLTDTEKTPVKDVIRVGVFPVAGDPLHWAHLLIGLNAMAEYKLDKVIYVVAADDPRKPTMTSSAIRHPMVQRALDIFKPFFSYSSIALGTDFDGERNIFRILELNPGQKIDAFYLVGADHYHRFNAKGQPDTIQKLESNIADKIYGFDNLKHSVSPIFNVRDGQSGDEVIPTTLNVNFVPAIAFKASSTDVRKGNFSLMPWTEYQYAKQHGLYALTPSPEQNRAQAASSAILTAEQLKLIDEAAKIFSLTDANKMYLAQMWAQYLMRRKGVETKESLRIVTDRSRVDAPDYKPDSDGNFILGSTLTDEEVKKMLGAFQYTQLKADPQNAAAASKAVITVSSMDGGIGESLNRLAFRKKLAGRLNLPIDNVKLSAKGTDLGFDVVYQGKEIFVSIAEAKLMQLVIMAENKKFAHVRFQPLVNWQSKESYNNLLDKTICVTDRMDEGRSAKRTYRELLESNGIEILPMVEQADLPAIEDKTGNISLSLQAPRQPGGHGNFGFYFLYEEYFNAPPEDGNAHIRIFYNGDNVNSSADEYITGAMIRNNWPIVKLTTVATPIDVKGGKDGVRVVRRSDGTLVYVPDQMEIADAKAMKQVDIFEKAGQEDGFGAAGRQPFNTNIFYINSSLLHSILQDLLKEGVVTQAQFYELISPTLITKPAKTGKDGEKYVPVDGAIGTAMHNLNAFFATNADPRVGEILKRHGVDRMLYFVDIPRTAFFTPVKKTYDMWLQSFSDYYKPLSTTTWKLEDSRETMTPPEFDLEALDEKGKETYWDELQNMIDSLGHASTQDLKSLTIKGIVLLVDAKLAGEVVIDNKSGKPVNLNEVIPQYKRDGRLVLQDINITIDENGAIIVMPKSSVGALRVTGGELAASEHGTRAVAAEQAKDEASVNGVIASRISDGMAYMLFENTRSEKDDIKLPVLRPAGIEELSWVAFITEIENLGINVIVIKGLKARLAELGIATDLFMHPGIGRRAVYLDEEDLTYLLSLPQGWRFAGEAVIHEKGHIENPSLSEAAVERAYPSYNVRLALTMKAAEPRRTGIQVVSRRFQQDGVYEYTDADGVEVSGMYRKPLAQFAEFGTAGVRWLVPGSLKTLETQYPDVARYIKSNGYEQEDFTKPNVAIIAKAIALYNQRKAMGYYRPVTGTTETFIERLNKGIVIAYDNRPNNIAYAKTIARVLTAYGVKAVLARVDGKDAAVSVPAVSLMVKREGYAGSIILTASHNGDMWNGIKFETEDGGQALSPVTGAIGTILREELSLEQPNYLETEESVDTLIARGTIATVDPVDYYVMSVLDFMGKDRVDLIRRAISEGNVSLKFSAFYGSSGVIMKKLFEKLGLPAKDLIQVEKPGENVFIASYEPKLERLPELKKSVSLTGRQAKAAGKSTVVLGGAADNDADRFQVNQYNPLTGTVEEFLPGRLAAVLGHYFVSSRNIKDGSFGRSFVSSHYQDSIAKLFGMSVNEQPTGFKYNNNGDNIYGEESYGMSVKGWTLDKDGILPTLLALELVATTGKSLGQYEQEVVEPQLVKAGLPTGYDFKRYDLALNKDAKDKAVAAFTDLYKKIADALKQGEIISFAGKKVTGCNYDPKKFSGWRFDMEDGSWVALRTSGTEPIIRFYRETLDKKSAEQVDDAFFSLTGLLKPKSESKDITPGAEQYEDAIYNTYVKGDKEKLQALLLSYGISLGDIENQTFILPIDDRLVSREDEIALEQNVNKYFNGKLIVVRGRDRQLLENLRSIDLKALGHYKIISGISSQTLAAIGDRDRAEFGTILNIDVPEGTFLSPIALVDVMIRIGLQSSNEVILGRMKEIFRKADGGTLTADDITQLVTMTNYLLKLSPVKEIKTEDMPEANLAVRAALKSL